MDPITAAAAESSALGPVPRDAIALDSWANLWLIHQPDKAPSYYRDDVILAHGRCACCKGTSHGVPTVHVPTPVGGNGVDLFTEGSCGKGCAI